VTGNRDLLTNIRDAPKSTIITTRGKVLPVVNHNKANLDENKVIDNILYIPGMMKNLHSIGKFADEGLLILFCPRCC
jgi:hypothetical protein